MNLIYILFSAVAENIELGAIDAARNLLSRVEELAESVKNIVSYAEIIHKLSDFYLELGDYEKAKGVIERLIERLSTIDAEGKDFKIKYLRAVSQATLLKIYYEKGILREDLLIDTKRVYEELAEEKGLVDYLLDYILSLYIPIRLAEGKKRELKLELPKLISFCKEILRRKEVSVERVYPLMAEILVELANIEIDLGEFDKAVEHAISALEIYKLHEELKENFCNILVRLLELIRKYKELLKSVEIEEIKNLVSDGLKLCENRCREKLKRLKQDLNL